MATLSKIELKRRESIWSALSDLFLDCEISDNQRKFIARSVVDSNYSEEQIQDILWKEVFPALCDNLRIAGGEWAGFDQTWLNNRILNIMLGSESAYCFYGLLSVNQVKSIVAEEWNKCRKLISADFSMLTDSSS